MVRFKVDLGHPEVSIRPRFHPTMVRFKVPVAVAAPGRARVSIPLWCDLKEVTFAALFAIYLFPSHYGAI